MRFSKLACLNKDATLLELASVNGNMALDIFIYIFFQVAWSYSV